MCVYNRVSLHAHVLTQINSKYSLFCSSIHIFKDIKNIPKHPHTHEDSHMDTSQDEQNFFLSKKCFLTTLFVSKFKYKQ